MSKLTRNKKDNVSKQEKKFRKLVFDSTAIIRDNKFYYYRREITFGVLGLIVPLVVFVFICRMLFTQGSASVNIDTLFLDILWRFGSQSWSTDMLMTVLGNFSEITAWTTDTSGILETLKTIASVVLHAGNVLLLIIALLLQAIRMIGFIFSLLFIG